MVASEPSVVSLHPWARALQYQTLRVDGVDHLPKQLGLTHAVQGRNRQSEER
jgi:hypothetical protein